MQRVRRRADVARKECAGPQPSWRSGNRVVPAGAERVASGYSLRRQPRPTNCAMAFDRFHRVRRARWSIAARGGKQRGDEELVHPDQRRRRPPHHTDGQRDHPRRIHRQAHDAEPGGEVSAVTVWFVGGSAFRRPTIAVSSALNASHESAYAPGRTRSTTSCGASFDSAVVRTNSRSRRFSRFRSTMSRPCFGMMNPTRAHDKGEAATRSSR